MAKSEDSLRSLNEAVAREVLGWQWDDDWGCLVPPEQEAKPSEMWTDWQTREDEETGAVIPYREPVDENHVLGIMYSGDGDAMTIHLPDWVGDTGHAWDMLETLSAHAVVEVVVEVLVVGRVRVKIWESGAFPGDEPAARGEAPDFPGAACEAALAFVRGR